MEPPIVPPPPMEYLIRFVQVHETFRKPEIEALALLAGITVEWVDYNESVYSIFLARVLSHNTI